MRTKVRKWLWAWQFDEEEAWLNEMAQKGKALVGYRLGTYEFEDCEPGEYTVRLEMLEEWPTSEKSQDYIRFVEDTGAEMVGRIMKWVYFRKKTEDGPFELHGNYAARIKHLRSIITLLVPLMIFNTFIGFYNLFIGITFPSVMNIICGIVNCAVSVLLAGGLRKLNEKKKQMEKDAQLFE